VNPVVILALLLAAEAAAFEELLFSLTSIELLLLIGLSYLIFTFSLDLELFLLEILLFPIYLEFP
jgi:hypothetical protein